MQKESHATSKHSVSSWHSGSDTEQSAPSFPARRSWLGKLRGQSQTALGDDFHRPQSPAMLNNKPIPRLKILGFAFSWCDGLMAQPRRPQ